MLISIIIIIIIISNDFIYPEVKNQNFNKLNMELMKIVKWGF